MKNNSTVKFFQHKGLSFKFLWLPKFLVDVANSCSRCYLPIEDSYFFRFIPFNNLALRSTLFASIYLTLSLPVFLVSSQSHLQQNSLFHWPIILVCTLHPIKSLVKYVLKYSKIIQVHFFLMTCPSLSTPLVTSFPPQIAQDAECYKCS